MNNDDIQASRQQMLHNWPVLRLVEAVLNTSRYLDNQSKENALIALRRLRGFVEGKRMNPAHLPSDRFLCIGGSYDGDFLDCKYSAIQMPEKRETEDLSPGGPFHTSESSRTEVYVKEVMHAGSKRFFFLRLSSVTVEEAFARLFQNYNPFDQDA